MKFKHITKLGTAILLAVLVFSCGKETQTTTQGGGRFIIKATFTPPLQFGQIVSKYNSTRMYGIGFDVMWDGVSKLYDLFELTTDELSVTSGQNIAFYFNLSNGYDFQCRNVKIEGIQNGKVIKTYNFSMGYSSPTTYCNDGLGINKNFIVQ